MPVNRLITQIYEIQSPDEARLCADCGVDHIGSVVVSAKDWRQSAIKETIRTVAAANAKSSLILLFNDKKTVFSALSYYQPNIVHFCEDLTAFAGDSDLSASLGPLIQLQAGIRSKFPEIQIMRSIPIAEAGAGKRLPVLAFARLLEPVSDYFLTDTWMTGEELQPVCGFVGITGKTCDWHAASELVANTRIPVILAGGLSPENVYDSVVSVSPAGVDSCTRTNAVDDAGCPIRFKKDKEKVRKFVREARRAEQELYRRAASEPLLTNR